MNAAAKPVHRLREWDEQTELLTLTQVDRTALSVLNSRLSNSIRKDLGFFTRSTDESEPGGWEVLNAQGRRVIFLPCCNDAICDVQNSI